MGSCKQSVENHIEENKERLMPDFVGHYFVEFIEWAGNQDNTHIWDLIEEFCEDVKSDEFWDFCIMDMGG